MDNTNQRQSAYEQLATLCTPFDLSKLAWSMGASVEVVACPPSLSPESLSQKFGLSLESLATTGLVLKVGGHFEIHPGLSVPGEPMLPLRAVPQGRIVDIVTRQGTLSGELPALAMLKDAATVGILATCDVQLLVTFSLDDLITLRSWGFAAIPAAGLEKLDAKQLLKLGSLLGWCKAPVDFNPPLLPVSKEVPDITVVAWSPASMNASLPETLAALQSYWKKVSDYTEFDCENMALWTVSASDLECLEFVHALGDPSRMFDKVVEQIGNAVDFIALVPPPVELSYDAARRALITALARRSSSTDIERTTHAYQNAVIKKIESLRDESGEEHSPSSSPLGLIGLTLLELLLTQEPFVTMSLNARGNDSPTRLKHFDLFIKTFDRLTRLMERAN